VALLINFLQAGSQVELERGANNMMCVPNITHTLNQRMNESAVATAMQSKKQTISSEVRAEGLQDRQFDLISLVDPKKQVTYIWMKAMYTQHGKILAARVNNNNYSQCRCKLFSAYTCAQSFLALGKKLICCLCMFA
jgi:hypothetical protein